MCNLGYKHRTDGKPYRVSWELGLLLNVIALQINFCRIALQINFCRMQLKSMGFLQNEKENKKSGSAEYSQHKTTASFKPLHVTYYTPNFRAINEDDCAAPSVAVQQQTKQARVEP